MRRVLAAAVPLLLAAAACDRGVAGEPRPARAAATPDSAAELEPLVVRSVPSGLPRLPDDALDPPAGETTVGDVAGYAADPEREREVLGQYGYRHGWERFWGEPDGVPSTSVFVHQHAHRAGADAYARDLAANEAEFYGASLSENAPGLPGGCWSFTVPEPSTGLPGPTAVAWCGHGDFSVSVTAIAGSLRAAEAEVAALLPEQLDRLPPS